MVFWQQFERCSPICWYLSSQIMELNHQSDCRQVSFKPTWPREMSPTPRTVIWCHPDAKPRKPSASLKSRRARLVVFRVEAGGRWSEEAAGFSRQLAKARARQSPDPLRQAVTAALIARWSALKKKGPCRFRP